MRTTAFLCAALALSASACGGEDSSSTAATSAATSSSGASAGSGSSSSGAPDPCAGATNTSPGADQIVINEINALGTSEWIEIANTSAQEVDLSCYAVADSVKGTAEQDLKNALRFPMGSSIGAGEYLLFVHKNAQDTPPVEHFGSDCLSNNPSTAACYYVTWEISGKNGEDLFFLTPQNELLTTAKYPPNAVDPTLTGTWARIPDMTGNFAASATPSPGGPNQP